MIRCTHKKTFFGGHFLRNVIHNGKINKLFTMVKITATSFTFINIIMLNFVGIN